MVNNSRKLPSGSTVRYVIKNDVKSLYVNEKSIPIGTGFFPWAAMRVILANLVTQMLTIDATIAFNGGGRWFIDDVSHGIAVKHNNPDEARKIDDFKGFAEHVLNSKPL